MTEATATNVPVRRKPGPKPKSEAPQAKHTPVQSPRKTISNAELAMAQPPDIILPESGPIERGDSIVAVDTPLDDSYTRALAMGEDAVTIVIEPSGEENAPLHVPCWVNGEGAELMHPDGKWFRTTGYLPVGIEITTKRKYVEVLARSRNDNIRTDHDDETKKTPENRIVRTSQRKVLFTVVEDRSPMARAWLTRLMAER